MNIENIQRTHDRSIEIWYTLQTGSLEPGGGRAGASSQTKATSENIRRFKILGCQSFFCQMVPLRMITYNYNRDATGRTTVRVQVGTSELIRV